MKHPRYDPTEDFAFPKVRPVRRGAEVRAETKRRLPLGKPERVRDPKALALYKRHHPTCEACAKRRTEDAHHLRSRAKGGSDVPENLLALCRPCHMDWATVNKTRLEWFRKHWATMTEEARGKVRLALRLT